MAKARVFQSGNSQAVRLPKQFRVSSKEVEIFQRGNELILRETVRPMVLAFDLLADLPDDFMQDGRQDSPPQEREGLE
jgi:antitoxin VapB